MEMSVDFLEREMEVMGITARERVALGEYPGYESPSAGFELSDNSNRD